jgi:hypothetical protein
LPFTGCRQAVGNVEESVRNGKSVVFIQRCRQLCLPNINLPVLIAAL